MNILKKPLRRVFHSALHGFSYGLRAVGASGAVSTAFCVWYEMPIDPFHYYSPLPDIKKVRKNMARWRQESSMPAVQMHLNQQLSFIKQLKRFSPECDNLPGFDEIAAAGYGSGYGEVEAHFLHCMIRYLKPRRVIEVGSGVSTYFALNALEMNAKDSTPMVAEMHCIEPFPTRKFETLEGENRITLQVKEVQNVPVSFFERLKENDILFIDSSHAGKIDSDVYFIYLEILPRLQRGVVVHIHDICFPFLTCQPEHSVFPLSMLWNEGALCQAFLAFNDAFEILMCQSYLHYKQPGAIGELLGIYDPQRHFPSSLWLRRVN